MAIARDLKKRHRYTLEREKTAQSPTVFLFRSLPHRYASEFFDLSQRITKASGELEAAVRPYRAAQAELRALIAAGDTAAVAEKERQFFELVAPVATARSELNMLCVSTLRLTLGGWENFCTSDGSAAVFEVDPQTGEPNSDTLDQIPSTDLIELAFAGIEANTLVETDQGN